MQKAYKTNGIRALCAQKTKRVAESLKKHYVEKVFATRFRNREKLIKLIENQYFEMTKLQCKKSYETNGILALLGQNPKKDSKIIEKALRREGLRIAFSQR